jgi:hypothetical protein
VLEKLAIASCVLAIVALLATAFVLLWPWRIDATAKADTNETTIAVGAGVDLAGIVSASLAAILDGPGVIAVHLRSRQLWRRAIPCVSIEALVAWLEGREPTKEPSKPNWLVARTDKSALPELGVNVLADLREVSLAGALTCGFADPILTGKTAAVLYPLVGVLGPLGEIDLAFDWSGKRRIDGAFDLSFRVVPARILLELLRFARRHVRWFSATLPAPT